MSAAGTYFNEVEMKYLQMLFQYEPYNRNRVYGTNRDWLQDKIERLATPYEKEKLTNFWSKLGVSCNQ